MTREEKTLKSSAIAARKAADAEPSNKQFASRALRAECEYKRQYLMDSKGYSYERATMHAFPELVEPEPPLARRGNLTQGGGRTAAE